MVAIPDIVPSHAYIVPILDLEALCACMVVVPNLVVSHILCLHGVYIGPAGVACICGCCIRYSGVASFRGDCTRLGDIT
ncbi:hypothetical protein PanWU01x14_317200, partial [Parasponia andersonii]